MFFGFNLAKDVSRTEFAGALDAYAQHMIELRLLASVAPLAKRHQHPVMDTATHNTHEYFTTMHFNDLAQVDAAVEHIQSRAEPTLCLHREVIRRVRNQVFLCFYDTP